jgi:hypothetical protein
VKLPPLKHYDKLRIVQDPIRSGAEIPLPDASFQYRILIVEDDIPLRDIGKLLLESQV